MFENCQAYDELGIIFLRENSSEKNVTNSRADDQHKCICDQLSVI